MVIDLSFPMLIAANGTIKKKNPFHLIKDYISLLFFLSRLDISSLIDSNDYRKFDQNQLVIDYNWLIVLSLVKERKSLDCTCRNWDKEWIATGPQDQLRLGSTGPQKSFAGLNYHLFAFHQGSD